MIDILLALLIFILIVWLVFWLTGAVLAGFNAPPMVRGIVTAIIALIALVVLFGEWRGGGLHWHVRHWGRW